MEGFPMANSKVQFTLASATEIAQAISAEQGLKAKAADLSNERQEAVMTAYQHIIADIAVSGVKLVSRGKKKGLPVKVMEALRQQLEDAGVSGSNVKRYSENVQKLLPVMPELMECTDSVSVALTLDAAGITSQGKLVDKFKPEADKVHKLAEQILKLDEAEYNRLLEVVREMQEDKAAEEAAKAKGDAVADDVDAMLDTLED
jgi:DNA-binding protein|tara:strand:- start:16245 stop:16853 length:609 start_codon:yes stop_codon:yes gene_type:complete